MTLHFDALQPPTNTVCAAGNECEMLGHAVPNKHVCPACNLFVHAICGQVCEEEDNFRYKTTCFTCMRLYGHPVSRSQADPMWAARSTKPTQQQTMTNPPLYESNDGDTGLSFLGQVAASTTPLEESQDSLVVQDAYERAAEDQDLPAQDIAAPNPAAQDIAAPNPAAHEPAIEYPNGANEVPVGEVRTLAIAEDSDWDSDRDENGRKIHWRD